MKILFISPQRVLSGASLSQIGLIEQLIQTNEIYCIVEDSTCEYALRLKALGATVYETDIPKWLHSKPKNPLKWSLIRLKWVWLIFSWKYRNKKTIKIIRDSNIDVIHSNLRITNIGGQLSRELNVPHIYHIREFGEEDFGLYPILGYKYTYKYMDKSSSKIIAVSKAIEAKYKHIFGDKVTTIYNGIDTEAFFYGNKKIFTDAKCQMAMISTIAYTKGQLVLAKALAKLPQSYRDKIYVTFAGAIADEHYKKDIDEIIRSVNMENQVHYTGRINNVYDLLKTTDILIVASKMEGFGRVTVEGMCSDSIVIGADTGGTKELLCNGKYGKLFQSMDEASLATSIKEVMDNGSMYIEIAQKAGLYARQKYSTERNAYNIMQIYQSIK